MPVILVNPNISRRVGETDLQYHRRIVYGKLVDKTLSDIDYTELSEAIYGQPYASDVARRMFYGSKRTLDVISTTDMSYDTTDDIAKQIADLKVERQKLFDQRVAFNKSIREVARQQELSEIIERAVSNGKLGEMSSVTASADTGADSACDVLVSLNDIHYGATVDNHWRKFNSDIANEMAANYCQKVIDIAKDHKAQDCYIYNAGDSISGNIHRSIQVTNRENVIEQICGVSELIAGFIYKLSPHFRNVYYVGVAGNHSRVESNKKDALVAERLDNLIGWYLEARTKQLENVTIMNDAVVDDTMFMIDIRGKNYVGVHGDFDTSASSVQNLRSMFGEKDIYAVLSGHLHHNKVDSVAGCKSVMAGSFLGMDDYCVSKRIVGRPEQLVCICDDSGIKCYYDIDLS